jgi:hypothetical protein
MSLSIFVVVVPGAASAACYASLQGDVSIDGMRTPLGMTSSPAGGINDWSQAPTLELQIKIGEVVRIVVTIRNTGGTCGTATATKLVLYIGKLSYPTPEPLQLVRGNEYPYFPPSLPPGSSVTYTNEYLAVNAGDESMQIYVVTPITIGGNPTTRSLGGYAWYAQAIVHVGSIATTAVTTSGPPSELIAKILNKGESADYPPTSQAGAEYSFTTVIDMNFPACEQNYPCPMVELVDRDTGTVVDLSTPVPRTWSVQGSHHIVRTTYLVRVPSDGRNTWNLRFRTYMPEQNTEDSCDWSVSLQITMATAVIVTTAPAPPTATAVQPSSAFVLGPELTYATFVAVGAIVGLAVYALSMRRRTRRQLSVSEVTSAGHFEVSIGIPSVGRTVTLETAPDHTIGSLVETLISTLNLPTGKTYAVEYGGKLISQGDFGKSLAAFRIKEGSKLRLVGDERQHTDM